MKSKRSTQQTLNNMWLSKDSQIALRLFKATKYCVLANTKPYTKIRITSYNIGDLVLCNHIQLKGLVHRFQGTFIIVGKYANCCDYQSEQSIRIRPVYKQPTNHTTETLEKQAVVAAKSNRAWIKTNRALKLSHHRPYYQ